MKYVVRIICILISIGIGVVLFVLFYFDNLTLSEILNFDVEGCDIILGGTKEIVKFALIDRLPIILLGGISTILFLSLVFVRVDSFISFLKNVFRYVVAYVHTTSIMIWQSNVKYLLLVPTLAAVYSAYILPVTYDEALTYYDFVKPSVWAGLALYPYPNNHVLFSLVANITNEIPEVDLLFRLRIPSLLASLLTWSLVYRFTKKFYAENVALFVVGLGMVVCTTFFYGFLARGYVFIILFLVICLYAAYNIIFDGNKRKDWILFALGGILGAYSVPSFLYPFLTVSVLIFIYNYKHIRTQIFYSALVGLGAVILYFPILVVGGVEALAQNGYVLPIARLDVALALPGYYKGTLVNIFYLPPYIIGAVILLVLVYSVYKRDKKTLLLWMLFCAAPCVLLLLHAVIPFFRVFNYYGFILIFLIGISLAGILKLIKGRFLLIGLLVLQILGLANFFMNKYVILLDAAASEEIVKELLEDNKRYYFHRGIETLLTEGNIRFEGERKGLSIETKVEWMTSVENAEKDYDYYLVLKEHDFTEKYKPWKYMIGPFGKPINVYDRNSINIKE